MAVPREFITGAQTVASAGRALVEALDFGDEVEIQAATAELLRVAEDRESGGTGWAGLTGPSARPSGGAPVTPDDALDQVLAELEVGGTLLAAGGLAERPDKPAARTSLAMAVDDLDGVTSGLAGGGAAGTVGFTARPHDAGPPAELFRERLPGTVDAIVRRTTDVGGDVVKGLAGIPAAAVQPVLAGAVALVPEGSALVKAGLRAVQRAMRALEELLPKDVRDKLRDWANDWWRERREALGHRLVAAMLSVGALQQLVQDAVRRTDLAPQRLATACDRLGELDARHDKVVGTIGRIVRVLTKLVGPLALLLAAATAWLYAAGALTYLLAFGAAIWLSRDYLDTGALLDRVPGIRTIVREATT
jgi:hypothetical protein